MGSVSTAPSLVFTNTTQHNTTHPPLCSVQHSQLTDLRLPDLSKMSRARELKACQGAGGPVRTGRRWRGRPHGVSGSRGWGGGHGGVSPHPRSCWTWHLSRRIEFHAPEPAVGWRQQTGCRRQLAGGGGPTSTARRALTLSACSLRTFLLASMSHLLPSSRRCTPAAAFWRPEGRRSRAGRCPPSCPSPPVPHLSRVVLTSLMLFIQF